MASYIRALREQNAINILSIPNRKIHSAYSLYVLKKVNLALTQ